jgi:uncharacterized protein YcbX
MKNFDSMKTPDLLLDSAYIYPLKSGPPLQVFDLQFDHACLRYDRQWMLVGPEGKFVSQRQQPKLNQLKLRDQGDHFLFFYDQDSLAIPKTFLSPAIQESLVVNLWQSNFPVSIGPLEYSLWFSEFLGEGVSFVMRPLRPQDERLKQENKRIVLGFQDSCPVHIANLDSVDWLEVATGKAFHPLQFRANLYVRTGGPLMEDNLEEFYIGNQPYRKIKDCSRCSMVNLAPGNTVADTSFLEGLSKFRTLSGSVRFGIYAFPLS